MKPNPPKKVKNNNNDLATSKNTELNFNSIEESKKDVNSLYNLTERENKSNQINKNLKSNKNINNNINVYNKNQNNENIQINNINNKKENEIKVSELNIKFGSIEFYQKLMKIQEENRMQFFTDEELNNLEYQYAIEIDKRSFCKLYFSLLKKQNILIFCLSYCVHDYNLSIMKFSFLMFQIIIFITVSTFFFTDNTLNNIYENKNKFNTSFMIRQLAFTFLICLGIDLIFKILIRTDNKIIEIKQETVNLKDGISRIKCKFIFYFIFSLIIILFGWFYISCFCAVFSNTQIILIKCAGYTLAVTFIFPFIFCLISPSFRYCSLRSKEKNKKCLYGLSKIMTFI